MSGLPTLSQFIENAARRSYPSNSYVIEPHWESLYVRYSKRLARGNWYNPVLDFANIKVEEGMEGKGIFTGLVMRLREEYPGLHLFVENTHERFGKHLLKMGFLPVHHSASWHGSPLDACFLLEARLCLCCKKRFVSEGWKTCCGDGDCIGSLSNRGLTFQEM